MAMDKICKIILAIFVTILLLPAVASAQSKVVVTIKPLHSLVAGVMGDTGSPKLLLRGNSSPHDFQIMPSQIQALQDADVVFYIDDSFETFLNRAFKIVPGRVRKIAVSDAPGLKLLPYRKGGAWEEHDHEHHHGHGHDVHGEEGHDMHIWLSPHNAKQIIRHIEDQLSEIYPQNSEAYKENARVLIAIIGTLDRRLADRLKGLDGVPFVVFHDAYQYFEHHYGLKATGTITIDPDRPPSAKRIRQIRRKLLETGAQCVFKEPQFSDRIIRTVIRGSNAGIGQLDPIGANIKEGPDLYFKMLEKVGENLHNCLTRNVY